MGGFRGLHGERAPAEGGLIVASVHMSHLDPCALANVMWHRRMRAMGKEELWNNKLFGKIIEKVGAFPVKRGAGDVESIKKCIDILQGGETVIVFPEGTRNYGEQLLPLNPGIVLLAKKSGAPILPVGISGTQTIMPPKDSGRKKEKCLTTVACGHPFTYAEIAEKVGDKAAKAAILAEVERQILELCQESGLHLKAPESSKA